MVVDDEPAILDIADRLLTLLGYNSTCISNGVEAVAEFERHPDDFDLLMTDLTMPEMNGMELIDRVRKVRPEIPVVVCSGYDLVDKFSAYPHLRDGVVCLPKPIRSKEFMAAVNDALGRSALN